MLGLWRVSPFKSLPHCCLTWTSWPWAPGRQSRSLCWTASTSSCGTFSPARCRSKTAWKTALKIIPVKKKTGFIVQPCGTFSPAQCWSKMAWKTALQNHTRWEKTGFIVQPCITFSPARCHSKMAWKTALKTIPVEKKTGFNHAEHSLLLDVTSECLTAGTNQHTCIQCRPHPSAPTHLWTSDSSIWNLTRLQIFLKSLADSWGMSGMVSLSRKLMMLLRRSMEELSELTVMVPSSTFTITRPSICMGNNWLAVRSQDPQSAWGKIHWRSDHQTLNLHEKKLTGIQKSETEWLLAFSFIFHRFWPFICCLSVVLWLDKGDFPKNAHTVCLR